MKRSGNNTGRGTTGSKAAKVVLKERRVATPDPELILLRTGKTIEKVKVSPKELAAGVLARVGKAMKKPGADRASLFRSASGKPVFAYFVYTKDPSKVVREDASGRQTVGRIVGGRFRPGVAGKSN